MVGHGVVVRGIFNIQKFHEAAENIGSAINDTFFPQSISEVIRKSLDPLTFNL